MPCAARSMSLAAESSRRRPNFRSSRHTVDIKPGAVHSRSDWRVRNHLGLAKANGKKPTASVVRQFSDVSSADKEAVGKGRAKENR